MKYIEKLVYNKRNEITLFGAASLAVGLIACVYIFAGMFLVDLYIDPFGDMYMFVIFWVPFILLFAISPFSLWYLFKNRSDDDE